MRKEIIIHFQKNDPVLFSIIRPNSRELTKSDNYFKTITRSIIGQQLSLFAARSIFNKFEKLLCNDISPKKIIETPIEQLRTAGLSYKKGEYLHALSSDVLSERIHLEKLDDMDDDEVIRELTQLKGVGSWTAEMFLMFALGREDIFSHNDIGLRNAVFKAYKLKEYNYEHFEKLSSKWKPYRSYASLILWEYLEDIPISDNEVTKSPGH